MLDMLKALVRWNMGYLSGYEGYGYGREVHEIGEDLERRRSTSADWER